MFCSRKDRFHGIMNLKFINLSLLTIMLVPLRNVKAECESNYMRGKFPGADFLSPNKNNE